MNRRTSMVLVDALFLMLLVLIILPHEIKKQDDPSVDLFAPMMVGIRWPDLQNTDVDLWVRGPGDRPVGYSRLRGYEASLLRDDLGNKGDDPVTRFEVAAFARLVDGEYAINVHLYADLANNRPIPVTVRIWRRLPGQYKELLTREVILTQVKQQVTVARFLMLRGEIVPGSVHDDPIKLSPG